MRIAVFGATGRTGRRLIPRLAESGLDVVALGRDPVKLAALPGIAGRVRLDLAADDDPARATGPVACVVSLAPAEWTERLLAAYPDPGTRFVLAGSTRRHLRQPDAKGAIVRRAEAAFAASGRRGVMLHPSLIYGAPGETTVQRVLDRMEAWPRRLPVIVPLPDGGRHTVQPIHVDDVAAAFWAAVGDPAADGAPVILAGPEPVTYAALVRACAAVHGRTVRILPLPAEPLARAMDGLARVGLTPPLAGDEVRRAAEDKRFDIADLRQRLGVDPRPLEAGLATLAAERAALKSPD